MSHIQSEEEKEFQRRGKNMEAAAEQIKKKVADLEVAINGTFGEQIRKIAYETNKVQRPSQKKDMMINGKKCYIALIEDGRVLIDFGEVEAGRNFFDEPRFFEREQSLNLQKQALHERHMYFYSKVQSYFDLPWYKRIFTKKPI